MEFGFTEEEKRLGQEVADFLAKEVTPEILVEQKEFYRHYNMWAPLTGKLIRKMGEKGWIVSHWPREYGGLGSSHVAMFLVHDVMSYFGLPDLFMGALWTGPTIMKVGSEELKKELLLPLARGDIEIAVAYTEPEAGCDLASLQLRAEDKGDHFLLNGQKVFTSAARFSKYAFLGVRTDWKNPKKHQGISILVVDFKSPGVTIRPLPTMGDWANNEVFFDDVRIPRKYLVGELNRGFYYLMTALDLERMFGVSWWQRLFDHLVEYTKEAKRNGKLLREDPLIRQKLAQIAIELEVARLLYYELAYRMDRGEASSSHSSMEKLFTSEVAQRLSNVGMQVMGLYGQLKGDSQWAALNGEIELHYRRTVCETLAGGTSEVQRSIIALRGLGLPIS